MKDLMTQAAPASATSAASAQSELADLTDALGVFAAKDESPPAGEEIDVDLADTEGEPEAKPEPAKKPAAKEEKKPEEEPQTIGKAWQQVRSEKKALRYREHDLVARTTKIEAREEALSGLKSEVEKLRSRVAILDKLREGDFEALEAEGIDFSKLTEGYLAAQSGDSRLARLERDNKRLAAQIEADKKERADGTTEQRERAQYETNKSGLLAHAKTVPALAKFTPTGIVRMAEAVLTDHLAAGGKPLSYQAVCDLMAKQLLAEGAAPEPTPSTPQTLSRSDSKVRAPTTSKPYSADDELAELQGDLKAGFAGR